MAWSKWIIIALLALILLTLLYTSNPTATVALPPENRALAGAAPPNPASAATAPVKPVEPPRGPNKVLELNTAEEAEAYTTTPGKPGILMVYAPWCGACKMMMPAYDVASLQAPPGVTFARLEGMKATSFMQKHQVRGFPTLILVKSDGTVERYNGGRDPNSLLSAVKGLLQVPAAAAPTPPPAPQLAAGGGGAAVSADVQVAPPPPQAPAIAVAEGQGATDA